MRAGLTRATRGAGPPYNDLPPGRYVFHVAACNNDGVWSSERHSPYIFHSTQNTVDDFVRLATVLLAIALDTFIYLARMRSYEASLKLRFDDRMLERTRLARDLHDTLLQTIQGSKDWLPTKPGSRERFAPDHSQPGSPLRLARSSEY